MGESAITGHVLRAVETATPSEAAKVVRRLVYTAIEEAYDESGKRYKSPHSDASIAKDVDCAENLVATVRDEFFGPIGEPPEIDAIRVEVAALMERATQLKTDADLMYKDLLGKADALNRRLDTLISRNGWKP